MFASRNNPLVSLNYAVFLYNTGDKAAAARQFHNCEKRVQAVTGADVDPEVTRCNVLLSVCVFAILKFSSSPQVTGQIFCYPWTSLCTGTLLFYICCIDIAFNALTLLIGIRPVKI